MPWREYDVDLNNLDGEAPLNFLSIDKLFTECVVAKDSAMADSGIEAKTLHPAVDFNVQFKVDNGTDLVLYADDPAFLELAQDPGSGTHRSGRVPDGAVAALRLRRICPAIRHCT